MKCSTRKKRFPGRRDENGVPIRFQGMPQNEYWDLLQDQYAEVWKTFLYSVWINKDNT